jgi:hypothetical protein
VLYVKAPVRLTNGATLSRDLTIVSPDAIYVKGAFNTTSPKRAAIVTGNRAYHLSSSFRDFTQVVSGPSGQFSTTQGSPTEVNKYTSTSTGSYTQSGFNTAYNEAITLPPRPHYLGYTAPATTQNVAVVAPLQRWGHDRILNLKFNMLDPWAAPNNTNRQRLTLNGSFVQLPDSDFAATTNYTNWPYTDTDNGTPVPQDDRLNDGSPLVGNGNIFIEPIMQFGYLEDLKTNPPPGFTKVRSWQGQVDYWVAP